MRLHTTVIALLAACTTSAPPAPETPQATRPEAPQAQPSASAPAPAAAGVPWRSAWPAGEGRVAFDAQANGRLFAGSGTTEVGPTTPCDGLSAAAGAGALWLPPGETWSYPPAPVVSAALVERAAWRLADVLGPGPGITPGVDAPDPALHRGIRVRSIRKVRRKGPPWQVVVGERRSELVVALTDKDADAVKAGVIVERTREALVDLASLPAQDLDGDGTTEIVVVGDGAAGSLRAVFTVDLVEGQLTLRSYEEHEPVSCITSP